MKFGKLNILIILTLLLTPCLVSSDDSSGVSNSYLSGQIADASRQTQLSLSKKIDQQTESLIQNEDANYVELDKRLGSWLFDIQTRIVLWVGGSIFFFGGLFTWIWLSMNSSYNVGKYERRMRDLEKRVEELRELHGKYSMPKIVKDRIENDDKEESKSRGIPLPEDEDETVGVVRTPPEIPQPPKPPRNRFNFVGGVPK